jgi:hypothetical protein
MGTLELVLWLALLAVLAGLFLLIARRMSRLVARTRELERFQRGVADIDARLDLAVMPLLVELDHLKRRSGDPSLAGTRLTAALTVVQAAIGDVRRLRAPRGLVDRTAVITWELERSARALELLEHALAGLMTVRGPRELEIQTTLKRGSLNLRHARDAIHVVAVGVARIQPADLAATRLRPRGPRRPTTAPDQGAIIAGAPPSDPSM